MTPTATLTDLLELIARACVTLTEDALHLAGARSISLQQWRAILVLSEMEDGARISAVARRVDVTVPATSRLLQRLAARELLSLVPDPDGSAAQVARLSEDGQALVRDAHDRRRGVLADIASRLEERDAPAVLAELASLMHELVLSSAAAAQ